jgi:hypothetical protein
MGIFRGFAAAQIDGDLSAAYSGGIDIIPAKKISLGMEGFYTGKTLPPRNPSSWFSEKPPLPERDFALYGLNLFFNSPLIGVSSDWAYSETFAFGRDLYGSVSLRAGDRPWRLSLGVDGGGSRFTDKEGTAVGAGFRSAAKLEWRGKRNSLFRVNTSLRAPGPGEAFNRSGSGLYYRFPSPPAKSAGAAGRFPFGLSKLSLTANRNLSDPKAFEDSVTGGIGFSAGPVRANLEGAVTGVPRLPEAEPPFPYPGAAVSYDFESFKVSGELGYSPGIFQFRVKLGCTSAREKEPVWDTSLYGSVRGKAGRFSVKLGSPDFPHTWTCTLSWRLERKDLFKTRTDIE